MMMMVVRDDDDDDDDAQGLATASSAVNCCRPWLLRVWSESKSVLTSWFDTTSVAPLAQCRHSQLATRTYSQLATRNSQLATRNSHLATRNSRVCELTRFLSASPTSGNQHAVIRHQKYSPPVAWHTHSPTVARAPLARWSKSMRKSRHRNFQRFR